ncbi:MAG: DUF4079 domain-containing protein [Arthrospira sp. SH-MAG29]|nr:DUF4079 domain-containing protein [Arthrospira sp. SH-MAG29]MBS0015755.1 DUF4079 domain-containing protein [Arthrospira sp. SH-MAG29]
MDLPSFLWLWKIAAWSMGLSITAYLILAMTGGWMFICRQQNASRPLWLRPLHYAIGIIMVILVLLLLTVGIIGTIGHYGNLGHSVHLPAGLTVVALVLLSAWSAHQINPEKSWARSLHITTNVILFLSFAIVSLSGWVVVQKYLP